jgi:hypothetical protein
MSKLSVTYQGPRSAVVVAQVTIGQGETVELDKAIADGLSGPDWLVESKPSTTPKGRNK